MGDQVIVNSIPLLRDRTIGIVRHCARDDVKAPGQQGLIYHRIALYPVRPEYPRFAGSGGLWHQNGGKGFNLGELDLITRVALCKKRPTHADVGSLARVVAISRGQTVIDAVAGPPADPV